MAVLSGRASQTQNALCIGRYTLETREGVYLEGNKLFQRHTVIAGSTGSGKSYTAANLLEQMEPLPSCSAVVLDIHGEYVPLTGEHSSTIKKLYQWIKRCYNRCMIQKNVGNITYTFTINDLKCEGYFLRFQCFVFDVFKHSRKVAFYI